MAPETLLAKSVESGHSLNGLEKMDHTSVMWYLILLCNSHIHKTMSFNNFTISCIEKKCCLHLAYFRQ